MKGNSITADTNTNDTSIAAEIESMLGASPLPPEETDAPPETEETDETGETGEVEKTKETEETEEVEKEEEEETEESKEAEESEEVEESEEEGEEVEEGEEEGEEDWRAAINEMARERLEEKKGSPKKAAEKKTEAASKEQAPPAPEAPSIKVSKEEWNEAMESESGFEAVIQRAVNEVDNALSVRLQQIVQVLPAVIKNIAEETTKTYFAISDFFQANRDLIPYKAFVSLTADKLFAKYPDKDYEEIMEDVGREVRKKLKLPKKDNSRAKKRRPAIVDVKASRKPKPPKLTGMEAEIAEMLNLQR